MGVLSYICRQNGGQDPELAAILSSGFILSLKCVIASKDIILLSSEGRVLPIG